MNEYKRQIKVLGNFIQGKFKVPSDPQGEWISKSPADLTDEIGKVVYSYSAIEEAVSSAKQGFKAWRKTSLAERTEILKKYQAALKRREKEFTEMISREVGKPLWESKIEHATMVNKVDVTIKESMKYVADFEIPNILENTLGVCRYRPHGVMAVIGPFNFPGHLPNGHIVPALLTGNSVIFKPSEKTPWVGQLMAECFLEAGIPPGVFSLVQGEREVGRRLCVHEGVDGILFTGSYEVGTRIKQDTLQQSWKILALEMGGKNPALVCEDADLELATFETLIGAYLTTGQRCSATSRILVHHKRLDEFTERFHQKAKSFLIGHPFGVSGESPSSPPFMGPLIDSSSVDRYMKFLGIASREGCEVLMRGKAMELAVPGNYVTPSICWSKGMSLEASKKSIYQQTEIFAPNVMILGVADLDEAIAQANLTQYGLVASVFTQSQSAFDHAWDELEMGLINRNKSTVGASSRLPFGGIKKSGNHFPTAVNATLYCARPVASLQIAESHSVTEAASNTPGLNWENRQV